MEFIRTHHGHRDRGGLVWGVEPICRVLTEHGLPIAPSTYYEQRDRTATRRQIRDEQVHANNFGVYGARKVWLQLNRERLVDAEPVARCTVEGLMGDLGLQGAIRGKVKRTTIADPIAQQPTATLVKVAN